MFEFLFKVWYMIAILPFLMFLEGNKKFGDLLKRKNIYQHWDILHGIIVVLVFLIIVFWFEGFR